MTSKFTEKREKNNWNTKFLSKLFLEVGLQTGPVFLERTMNILRSNGCFHGSVALSYSDLRLSLSPLLCEATGCSLHWPSISLCRCVSVGVRRGLNESPFSYFCMPLWWRWFSCWLWKKTRPHKIVFSSFLLFVLTLNTSTIGLL